MNFEFERELGFINSQPSLAECLTALPAVLETFQTSSIKDSTLIPPPLQPRPDPPPGGQERAWSQKRAPHGLGQPPAAQFPWMREKKPSRKGREAPSSSSSSPPSSSSSLPLPSAGSPAGWCSMEPPQKMTNSPRPAPKSHPRYPEGLQGVLWGSGADVPDPGGVLLPPPH